MSQIIKVEFSSSQTNAGKIFLKEFIGLISLIKPSFPNAWRKQE